jgi:hypothetical protein
LPSSGSRKRKREIEYRTVESIPMEYMMTELYQKEYRGVSSSGRWSTW